MGLQLVLEVPLLHCFQEDLSLGLQLALEVPRLHYLQEELPVEELNGAHLEALEVQQKEAQHHHRRHLEVFLRTTLHTPGGSRAHHLRKLLKGSLNVPLGNRGHNLEEELIKMPITNPENCRALLLRELLWASLGVP